MTNAPIHHAMRPPSSRLMTREFLILGSMSAVFFACTGGANALMPRFVVDELGGSETTAGIVMGSLAISSLLTRPWYGRLADRRGAKLLLIIGTVIAAAGYAVLLVPSTVGLAIVSRLIVGAGQAGLFVGMSMLAMQIAPDDRRSEAASYMLVSVHVGLGMGPIAGEAVRNSLSYDTAWLLVVGMILISTAIALTLPDRPGSPDAEPAPLIQKNAIGPGLASFFGVFAFSGFLTFLPLYGREVGLEEVGLVFTVASLTIVVMRVLFGRVPDLVGPIRAANVALIVTVVATFVVALWAAPAGLYVGAALLAIGLSLQSPSFMALAIDGVDERERGSAMATYTGFFDLAGALVGPTIGLMVSGVSYQAAFLVTGAMSLAAIAVLQLMVAPRHQR